MASEFKNWYQVLGVSRNATQEQILNAWRKLANKYHPDHNKNNKEYAERKMKEINEAKSVLTNPSEKRAFDAKLNSTRRNNTNSGSENSNSNGTNWNAVLRELKRQEELKRAQERKAQEEQKRKERERREQERLKREEQKRLNEIKRKKEIRKQKKDKYLWPCLLAFGVAVTTLSIIFIILLLTEVI